MSGTVIIQTAFLGDVVLTTPLICAASERLKSKVSVVVIPSGASLLGGKDNSLPPIEEVLVYDKKGADKGFRAFLKMAQTLREKRFDVAIVPHRSARSAMLAFLAKIPIRVGFNESALASLFTHRVPRRMELHEVDRNLELLKPFGGVPTGYQPKLCVCIPQEAREKAKKLLSQLPRTEHLIGIAPGSVWGTKRWLPEGFAEAMNILATKTNSAFVILGSSMDKAQASEVASKTFSPFINLAGATTISELCAVIEMLDLFITNDSGPMHVAVALDVPVVAIFGATTPELGFTPYTDKAIVVEPPYPLQCRPCSAHGPKTCPLKHFECMRSISPQTVAELAMKLLTQYKK